MILFFLVPGCWLGVPAGGSMLAQGSGAAARGDLPAASRIILGVTLGRTNLAEVQARLGRSIAWSEGDASAAEEVICYATPEPHPTVIVFGSNSEMAGPPDNEVTDIRVVKGQAYAQRTRCAPLPQRNIGTPSGLALGISREVVRAILGKPLQPGLSKWRYSWSTDMLLPRTDKNYGYWLSRKEECFEGKQPFFTTTSEVEVLFDRDGVAELDFRRIESIC